MGKTQRLFTDCCYGTAYQHTEAQECRLAMHFDSWTGSYRDRYNDVFVSRPHGRKQWIVSSREPGNQTLVHSRHNDLDMALAAASDVLRHRLGDRLAA